MKGKPEILRFHIGCDVFPLLTQGPESFLIIAGIPLDLPVDGTIRMLSTYDEMVKRCPTIQH